MRTWETAVLLKVSLKFYTFLKSVLCKVIARRLTVHIKNNKVQYCTTNLYWKHVDKRMRKPRRLPTTSECCTMLGRKIIAVATISGLEVKFRMPQRCQSFSLSTNGTRWCGSQPLLSPRPLLLETILYWRISTLVIPQLQNQPNPFSLIGEKYFSCDLILFRKYTFLVKIKFP